MHISTAYTGKASAMILWSKKKKKRRRAIKHSQNSKGCETRFINLSGDFSVNADLQFFTKLKGGSWRQRDARKEQRGDGKLENAEKGELGLSGDSVTKLRLFKMEIFPDFLPLALPPALTLAPQSPLRTLSSSMWSGNTWDGESDNILT